MKLIFLILLLVPNLAFCQLNVELLHQLVEHSKDEYERQKDVRDRQAITSANEEVNNLGTGRLKKRYREIRERFNVLQTALQGLSMSIESTPIIERIIVHQKKIVELASDHPEYIPLALKSEQETINKAVQLGRYITGLFLVLGDLNQMKSSDRRLLYAHILDELRQIEGVSRGLVSTLYYKARKKSLDGLKPFGDFMDKDRRIVDDILRQLKEYKP
ncbi:conserved hypothetical protein [Sphingobacterium sp. PM2-P1-29]|nr:conserved hypothetical protein [Sphingobacterium sp. PM2-P1-29]